MNWSLLAKTDRKSRNKKCTVRRSERHGKGVECLSMMSQGDVSGWAKR